MQQTPWWCGCGRTARVPLPPNPVTGKKVGNTGASTASIFFPPPDPTPAGVTDATTDTSRQATAAAHARTHMRVWAKRPLFDLKEIVVVECHLLPGTCSDCTRYLEATCKATPGLS